MFIVSTLLALAYFAFFTPTTKNKQNIKILNVKNNSTPVVKITSSPKITPTITLDSIFSSSNDLSNYNKNELVTIAATGDFIPARSVNYQTIKNNNFLWTIQNVSSYFTKADIVFVNLESPIFKNCPITNQGFVFCGEDKHINALTKINTSVVNLANNHLSNYGENGYLKTKNILKEANILTTGDQTQIIEKKGTKFAFLGYNDIGYTPNYLYKADLQKIENDIKQAKKSANVVIVQFHFGAEYSYYPDTRQVELAKSAVGFGADLIIGNHPHYIQPVQIYKNKVIMYAHGNFVFDQMWSEETKQGVIGYYTFYKNNLVDVKYKPVYIKNYGEGIIPNTYIYEQILNKLKQISIQYSQLN